jgi:hypothetical protein
MNAASLPHEIRNDRICQQSNLAQTLAHAFRDKFDFSDPKDYDKLADHAFAAADALMRKEESLLRAENAVYDAEVLAEQKAEQIRLAKEEGKA